MRMKNLVPYTHLKYIFLNASIRVVVPFYEHTISGEYHVAGGSSSVG